MMANVSPLGRVLIFQIFAIVLLFLFFAITNSKMLLGISAAVSLACSLVLLGMTLFQKRKWFYLAISSVSPGSFPVTLIDFEGDVYHSLARKNPSGTWECPLYYLTNTGRCLLMENGLVDPSSGSSYVKYWMPIRTDELVLHQLVNDIPDIDMLRKRAGKARR